MTLIGKQIADSRVLILIQQMLKAGYEDKGRLYETPRGTPQGGVVSPLLSNILLTPPSVPMKVRHLSPGIFRLEGAEGSSHSCPCSRSRLIQQVAPPRSVCADRRLYRRHPLRHPNSPIARGDGRSLPRTSCAS